MKALIIFAVILTVVCHVNSNNVEEKVLKHFLVKAEECKPIEGATDADIAVFKDKKVPTTRQGKCVVACVGEKDGVIKDGKFDKKGFLESISTIVDGDATKLKLAEDIFEKCSGIADGDRCEYATKMATCIHKEGTKLHQASSI